jgi:hypothetical protein
VGLNQIGGPTNKARFFYRPIHQSKEVDEAPALVEEVSPLLCRKVDKLGRFNRRIKPITMAPWTQPSQSQ